MTATFVDRIQLQDDKVELWMQPATDERMRVVEIGMRFKQGATSVSLMLAPNEAALFARRLLMMSQRAVQGIPVAADDQYPDF